MIRKLLSTTLFSILLITANLSAQDQAQIEKAKSYVVEQYKSLDLLENDVLEITHLHTATLGQEAGFVHYFGQTVNGHVIDNAMVNVLQYNDGNFKISGSTAISNIEDKIADQKFRITGKQAIAEAAKRLGEPTKSQDITLTSLEDGAYVATNVPFVDSDIVLIKKYILDGNAIVPVWSMDLDVKASADYFNVMIHAETGDLVKIRNFTTYCSHEKGKHSDSCGHAHHKTDEVEQTMAAAAAGDGASYRVYAWPAESPLHGEHELVVDPSDEDASPFGWHDTNGAEGAEYTITRGNNAHAYEDRENNNSSVGNEPDGGDDLVFDFTHMQEAEPIFSLDAAVVNLFYTVNKMHDFAHFYGFNEGNGNFQSNNYGNGGAQNDFVRAEALDGSGTDNANFATPGDGGNGRMQMFLWNQGGDRLVSVEEPAAIAGFIEVGLASDDVEWAFDYADSPVEGELVLAYDSNFSGATQVCGPVENVSEVSGNIALVDRGSCFFIEKAANAEAAGATACVICNVEGVNGGTGEELLTMAAGEGFTTTIPTVFMAKSSCDLIRSQMAAGETVILKIEERETSGPSQLDASFDNAVIAHEFGHGISTRLTGGPGNSGCLFNIDTDGDGEADTGEQMGEGWSDYFALVTGTDADNTGADIRGMSPYVNGEDVNGRGIRVFPYSTDMTICPLTYSFIPNQSVPHGVGAVWCAMLWDMYWAFVDEYGFDPDYKNTESGNYKAIKLVMDGMMIQPCRPGFVDGRDAIFEADRMNFDGEHECLLWEVFARRGLGFYADQGDSMDHLDGFENFDPMPTCIKTLKVQKVATNVIKPGEMVEVEMYYANHTEETAMNVVVTDEIPDGLAYSSSTASVEPEVSGNVISWSFGDKETLSEESFTVTYVSDENTASKRLVYDPINDIDEFNSNTGEGHWEVGFENIEGVNIFQAVTIYPNSGDKSWWVESVSTESDQYLDYHNLEVTGEFPVLRIWQAHNTEFRVDGGFILISTDNGNTFQFVDDKWLYNGYNSELQYGTFAIPSLFAFSGDEREYYDSYLDLSDFAGQNITVRFRWGSDANTSPPADNSFLAGWYIDDFELLDLKMYEARACIDADNADGVCAVINRTIVDTGLELSSTSDLDASGTALEVYPNPNDGQFTVAINEADRSLNYQIGLYTMQGRLIQNIQVNKGQTQIFETLDARGLSNGMYMLQVSSKNGIITDKIVINK